MSHPADRSSPTTPRTGSPRLAECWADLTRVLTLYPETNSRVLSSLAGFLEVLRETIDPEAEQVELGFTTRYVWVDGQAFELKPGSNLAWLKERLDRADLSGAVFRASVEQETLLAFLRRLLELYTRRDLTLDFAALWPESYAGIAPLERRFDGAFSDRREEGAEVERPAVAGRARSRAETLHTALAKDERIVRRIEELQAHVLKAADKEQALGSIDLLAEIVELLPAEGLHDYPTAVELTSKVLESLERELASNPARAAQREDARLRQLLFALSRSHFGNADPPPPVAPPPAPDVPARADRRAVEGGSLRGGDEAIQDDLSALLAEVAALAPLETAFLPAARFEDPIEGLGVLLHYLVTLDDPGRFPALQSGLERLLHAPGKGALEILRIYLQPPGPAGEAAGHPHFARVAVWLRRNGGRELLERCGVLDAKWVCRTFPEEFVAYVQTLDFGDGRDREELDQVCREVGPERFAEASELFAGASAFLAGPQAQRLFDLPLASVVPFARQVYERDRRRHRGAFARMLRATTAKGVDQAILRGLEDFVVPGYLSALCEDDEGRLAEQRMLVVRSFLAAADEDPRVAYNVRALKLLASFDSLPVRALLKRLVGARRNLILRKHPANVRKAAAEVLRSFRQGGPTTDV